MELLSRVGRFVQSLDPSVVTTGMWVFLIFVLLAVLGRKIWRLLDTAIQRVEDGSAIEFWKFKIEGAAVPAGLESLGPQRGHVRGLSVHPDTLNAKRSFLRRVKGRESNSTRKAVDENLPDWTQARRRIGEEQRGVHLAHLLGPTREAGQEWEIFIYLVAGAERTSTYGLPSDVSDVVSAEFYLGHMWGDRTTAVSWTRDRDHLGIRALAYAPVICLCRITFRDGHTAVLSRFIDFEMSRLMQDIDS